MPISMNTGKMLNMKGTSMRFQGKWNQSREYENSQDYIDLAESDGSLWICEQTNIGIKPVEGEYWALAAKGVSEESLSSINTQIEENRAEIVEVNNNLIRLHCYTTNVTVQDGYTLIPVPPQSGIADKTILATIPVCQNSTYGRLLCLAMGAGGVQCVSNGINNFDLMIYYLYL